MGRGLIFLTGFLCVLAYSAAAAADFQDGYDAYERGDYETAMREWRPLAEQGDREAQHNVGLLYYLGFGVAENNLEAAKWFRMAARQGLRQSEYYMGEIYDYGYGVAVDRVEAAMWYRRSADQGDRDAQYALGRLYQDGDGVPQSDDEARKWYRRAADQGQEEAQEALASMRDAPVGVPSGGGNRSASGNDTSANAAPSASAAAGSGWQLLLPPAGQSENPVSHRQWEKVGGPHGSLDACRQAGESGYEDASDDAYVAFEWWMDCVDDVGEEDCTEEWEDEAKSSARALRFLDSACMNLATTDVYPALTDTDSGRSTASGTGSSSSATAQTASGTWELWVPPQELWYDPPSYDRWSFAEGGYASARACLDSATSMANRTFEGAGNKANLTWSAIMSGVCYDPVSDGIYKVNETTDQPIELGGRPGDSAPPSGGGSSGGTWDLMIPPWDDADLDEYEYYEGGFASLWECQDFAEDESLDVFFFDEDLSWAIDDGVCYNETTDEMYWAME